MKIRKRLCSLFVSSLVLSSVGYAATLKLDFGSEESPVFQGFQRVTDQLVPPQEARHGFIKGTPKSYYELRPNSLAGDFVYSPRKSTLQVNLPDGKYQAWFLYGGSRYTHRVLVPLPLKYQIRINGQVAVSDPINGWQDFYSEKHFFRGYREIYHRGDDFYDKYVAPNFGEALASFEVNGGKVLIELEDMPLCAMVVYGEDEFSKMEDDLSFLRKELRRHTIISERKVKQPDPDPVFSVAEREQGYVTYSRSPSQPPLPEDRPLAEELGSTPRTFMPPGEISNVTLSILPLQDLENVKVSISDLVEKDSGATIRASESIRLHYIALQEVLASGMHRTRTSAYLYEVRPTYLKPFPEIFPLMDEGINRTISVEIKPGKETTPGVYEGTLTIAPENAPVKIVPLQVHILPFTLPELPIIAGRYAMDSGAYYHYYWSRTFTDPSFEEFVWKHQRERMQWVKEMGLNSIAFSDDLRGDFQKDSVELDPNGRMVKWMDLYRDMGLQAMPWYGFQSLTGSVRGAQNLGKVRNTPEWTARYHQLIEGIRDLGKERGWPEIIFYLSDELSNRGEAGTEEGLQRIAASDGIPGIRRIMSMNGKHEHALLNENVIAMPNYAFPITDETLHLMAEKGAELWLYNVKDKRFTWGYYPFLTKAKGRFQWYQSTGNGYPFDDFDCLYGDTTYSAFVAGPEGPVTKVDALEMREGLQDLRYLTLMQTLMQSPDASAAGVEKAKAILDEIGALSVDLRSYASEELDPTETGFETGDAFWSVEKCEAMRWRIAEVIMELGQ